MESPSNGEGGQDTASHSAAECMGDDDVALGVRREDANPNERPQVLCLSLRCVQITGGRRSSRSKHTRVPPWRTWRPPSPVPTTKFASPTDDFLGLRWDFNCSLRFSTPPFRTSIAGRKP